MRLDGEALKLIGLRLDGETLSANRYTLERGALVIHDLPPAFTLEIETEIDPAANTELSGLYLSNGSFFTQCEAEGFRRITYFPDRPDVMARFTVTVEADAAACPVLLSNGNPEASGTGAGWPALGALGRSASETVLPVRAGRGRSGGGAGPLRHRLRPAGRSWHLGATRATRTGASTPCAR